MTAPLRNTIGHPLDPTTTTRTYRHGRTPPTGPLAENPAASAASAHYRIAAAVGATYNRDIPEAGALSSGFLSTGTPNTPIAQPA